MYVHGDELGFPNTTADVTVGNQTVHGNNTCVLPVFKSNAENQNRLFFGSIYLSYFYTVLDQTPIQEKGLDYIQIGIGPRNPHVVDYQVSSVESPDTSVPHVEIPIEVLEPETD